MQKNNYKDNYKKSILTDKNGRLIRDGDKIKKITNIDIGRFKKGVVKWDDIEGCFKCGDTILLKEYMSDFIVVGNIFTSKIMKIGTRSVLYGAHCFFIHPIFVFIAWWKLFGFPYDLRLWVAFFVHDLGYWGKPNMDGEEGEKHPEFGAIMMHMLFDRKRYWYDNYEEGRLNHSYGESKKKRGYKCIQKHITLDGQHILTWRKKDKDFKWHNFTLNHSRYYAKRNNQKISALCVADKYAIVLEPTWFYLIRVILSGEIKEYTATTITRHEGNNMNAYTEKEIDVLRSKSRREWFNGLKLYFRRWCDEAMQKKEFRTPPHFHKWKYTLQERSIVYAKDGKIKVFNTDQALDIEKSILADGYTHVQTIDVCKWMEYIHNECDYTKRISEIKSLSEMIK